MYYVSRSNSSFTRIPIIYLWQGSQKNNDVENMKMLSYSILHVLKSKNNCGEQMRSD